jgi:hypothetical protein
MVIGMGRIVYRIHDCRSLKGKRKVVKAIIARLRNNFNASVAEIGANDVYQRAEIGFNMAEDLGLAEVIDSEMEIFNA